MPLVCGGPAQIQMMMGGLEAAETGQGASASDGPEDAAPVEATPEALAYNRAQYESVIRALWEAQSDFDTFVASSIEQACGEPGAFAVFGHGWRYELWPLDPYWSRASDSADFDVEILGSSYAAQDGRYRYDFSAVRTTFDRQVVGAAVHTASAEYAAIGRHFVEDARARVVDDMLPGGESLQRAVNEQAAPIRERLEGVLKSQAPAGNGALFQALLNGEPIGSQAS